VILYEYKAMMQNTILILAITLAIFFYANKIYAQYNTTVPETTAPIVVELYTSQGCSSCPPADKILSNIAAQENIIALGFHVTYWNHLNWKDTLSQEYFDIRQHGYAAARNSRRIYTPQMIVNGTNEFVGSHGNKVSAALHKAAKNPIQPINITMQNDEIKFTLQNAPSATYRLWAFGYKHKSTQNIGRGENSGRTIDYANSVISYTNLGAWDGQSIEHKFTKPNADIDGIAILAQTNGYDAIIAAGKLELKK